MALEDRIDADLALGRHSQLVPELETLVREEPFRERVLGQLMLALYRSGRQAEALAALQAARHRLAEELGLEPGQQLPGTRGPNPASRGEPRSAKRQVAGRVSAEANSEHADRGGSGRCSGRSERPGRHPPRYWRDDRLQDRHRHPQ